MMQEPLLISSILSHAVQTSPDQCIVTALDGGEYHEYDYTQFNGRVRQLAQALLRRGIAPGDRVATLAWNTYRHLEIYYAVSGIAAVCHTVNPRLYPEQIAFIINDAKDRIVFVDTHFRDLVERLRPQCPCVEEWVWLEKGDETALTAPFSRYDAWLAEDDPTFDWPVFDENTAAGLCYTSGTTGNPKGALYSHRSTILHAWAICHPDGLNVSCRDVVLPVVPMFHVNAWGLPYASLLSGAKLALPGANLRGEAVYALCEHAGVTMSAGVPTVWQGVLDHVTQNRLRFSTLRRLVIGGSACPAHMIKAYAEADVKVSHAWGMTEVSPVGTVCTLLPEHDNLPEAKKLAILATQGRPLFGVQIKVTDDEGHCLPWDGQTAGNLMIRGNWVIERYYNKPDTALDGGWFATGDVASVDGNGYVRITDRSKDVIKSGGEWISSIAMENIAMEHPAVQIAACIARKDEKWGERPMLAVVLRQGMQATEQDILDLYRDRVERWAAPDSVFFIEEMPLTATGKIQKSELRKRYPMS
ncbi:long-chain-fatty-acid--CoA ligase [Allopusillimonas soli]|uniref:Long-chain fatty acid--CoA ligase n=2 Tax=Allopusillimonas soli TaxID=659016 RepID=A0A853FA92_9BURK|nr:long-chain fatty acid--CoA ligase [Allopusillimonas soli]TEA75619.1 long-chain-fatty-acid--CoA ligase [Allopusillimonas soli]